MSGGKWQPGQSGNPRGRPKKARALTKVLESALSKRVELDDGKFVNGKAYVASLIKQALTHGSITLASGAQIQLSPEDVVKLLQWTYAHIDGAPRAELDVTTAGQSIMVVGLGIDTDKI